MFLLAGSATLMAQSYFIKGPEVPKPYETTAIQELTDYLAKRIDGKLVIGGKSPITFMVGDTELAKSEKCLSTELEDERWVVKSVGDKVLVNGGGTRGALYATYHFLEDVCDIHWWSDYEEYVPAASSMTIDALNLTGKPMFIYRDIYRSHKPANSIVTAARFRLNRDGETPTPLTYGGSFSYGSPAHCHNYDRLIPFSKYGKEHPEYFSLVNGKRVGGQMKGQLCLTNPAVRQLMLEKVLEAIENDKTNTGKKGFSAPRIYDVSMNDNEKRCECDACKAEEEKYNPSGLTLNFVNWIAAEVAKKHPDLFISILAYLYNEPPPKGGVTAADNVIVKLCDTRTNQAASILEPENKVYMDLLTQWKKVSKHIFIWDYAIVFRPYTTGLPFASELHYGDLYMTYYENNVSGVFWEHEKPYMADFYELKFFLEAKLFEDPYQDVNILINTFMTKYYGNAAKYLMQYRRRLDELRRKNKGYISWMPAVSDFSYITDKNMGELQRLFDKAEASVAKDATLFARVRRARTGLDRLNCQRAIAIASHGMGGGRKHIDSSAAYSRLKASWKSWVEGREFDRKNETLIEIDDEVALFSTTTIKSLPAPKELEGRKFYDVYAPFLRNESKKYLKIVDDAESAVGMAMRTDVDKSDYFLLPFVMGIYDLDAEKELNKETFEKPISKGYNWYKFGKAVKLPKKGYLYMTRGWTTQMASTPPEFSEKEFDDIWVSVKFTGPKFFDGSQDKNHIYIDRVLLILPE